MVVNDLKDISLSKFRWTGGKFNPLCRKYVHQNRGQSEQIDTRRTFKMRDSFNVILFF